MNAQQHQTNFKLARERENQNKTGASFTFNNIHSSQEWNVRLRFRPAGHLRRVCPLEEEQQSVGVLMTLYAHSIESVRRSRSCSVSFVFLSFTDNIQVRRQCDGINPQLHFLCFGVDWFWKCSLNGNIDICLNRNNTILISHFSSFLQGSCMFISL